MFKIRNLFIAIIFTLSFVEVQASGTHFPDFTQLVENIGPAVVNVSAERENDKNAQKGLLEKFFRRNQPDQLEEYTPPQKAEGSGFIVSQDGYILTNRHVVNLADSITVRMSNGREYTAKLVGEDRGTDVALLKIAAEDLPVIPTGNSEQLKVGEWVLGFGAPFGFDQTVTAGIVSAKRRTLGSEQYVPYIQTDVAINPGNSGGPLVSMDGKVVGINSQILSRTGGYIGISFAIPIELALHVAEQFKKFGKVHRGYLGVQYQDVSYKDAKWYKMDKVEGAILTFVTPGSVAAAAGLQKADIILKFDGKQIKRSGELPFVVGLIAPGETVMVDILRNGAKMRLDLTVGERPDAENAVATLEADGEMDTHLLGLVIENLNKQRRQSIESDDGILVKRVHNGAAARAGIREGDILMSLANKPISSVEAFNELIAELPRDIDIPILVLRGEGNYQFLSINIPN